MAAVLAAGVAAGAVSIGSADTPHGKSPYAGNLLVRTNPHLLGQAVDWLDSQHVVYQATVAGSSPAQIQLFSSTLGGADKVCLTCGLSGPNQVPVVQPHGSWILFHSWHGHRVRAGSPGFGGLGSDVWVMTRDGRQRTDLTPGGELRDNFHAYWSPDGRYIVWTELNWNPATGGNGKSDVVVARFVTGGRRGPHLVDEHAVRPGNGHWYETQWWAPDGSGFLYTETYDTAVNPELFFCRLPDPAHGTCRPQRLTNNPAWDEQAVFTPDMSRIIFMSSRNLPGALNDWSKVATFLTLPASYDYVLILPVFSHAFLQPSLAQATDLYEITLRWNRNHTHFAQQGPVRRLTRSGEAGWVIPEFAWDPSGRRLLWTENNFRDRVDQACVMRQLRRAIIGRVSGVKQIGQVPFDIDTTIRADATDLLRDPTMFSYRGACGTTRAGQSSPVGVQRTVIGQFAGSG
jgi:hypothetical protein